MIYIGRIKKNGEYYNFEVRGYIDNSGKVNKASLTQVSNDIGVFHPEWDYTQIERGNQITIWVRAGVGGNATLNEYAEDGRKLIWNIDLSQNIERRLDKKGFTTVRDYTVENEFQDISNAFHVRREDYETVTRALAEKLESARGIMEEWLSERKNRYGVNDLSVLEEEDKNVVVTDINNLFPDFNNPNYGEIYGNCNRTAAYLLKYEYAYTYLYKSLYRDIFARMDECEPMDVLSIGCGSKIDMAGLKLALLDTDRDRVAYYGIDLNDWTDNNNMNFCLFPDQGCFDAINIIDYLRRENDNYNAIKSNVIIFPYSMSELVDAGEPWEVVLNELPGRLMCDNVYIATNIRSNKEGEDNPRDTNAFNQLIEAMENVGYVQQERLEKRGLDDLMYIADTEDGLTLSQALNIGKTRDNTDTVAGYLCSIKKTDEAKIKHNAITGAKYIRYNIAKFRRGNQ